MALLEPRSTWVGSLVLMTASVVMLSPAAAMHETDHRFVVDGYVCGPDGQPLTGEEVIVKDPKASVGASVKTDNSGRYSATLHLHNENQGDPILVSVRDEQKRITAKFDPKNTTAERRAEVHFGSGCEHAERGSNWIYYGLGAGLVGVAAFGMHWVRRQRAGQRGRRRGKKPG